MDILITLGETYKVGNQLGIDWDRFSLEKFRLGLVAEYKLRTNGKSVNVTYEGLLIIGTAVLANLNEFPGYYKDPAIAVHRQNSSNKFNNTRYAVDASNDSIIDAPFTETYQSSFKENRRENNKDLPDLS